MTDEIPGITKPNQQHYAYMIDKSQYSYYQKESETTPIKEQVLGGILSHHFFTEKYIANFFNALKEQKPSVIIILSPNHFYAGSAPIAVSRLTYQTPWGKIDPDLNIIKKLEDISIVQTDEYIFEREHGLSVPIGFLPKIFPHAKIVPIAIKKTVPAKQIQKLAEELNTTLPKDALVLASIDFSHHLNTHSSSFHDAVSEAAIKSNNFASIYNLEIDSPPSLYAFLKYVELRGGNLTDIVHTNQAEIAGIPESEDVTSYFFALYTHSDESHESRSVLSLTQWPIITDTSKITDEELFTGPEKNNLRGQDISIIPYHNLRQDEIIDLKSRLAPFNTSLFIDLATSCIDQKEWVKSVTNTQCSYRKTIGSQTINITILSNSTDLDTLILRENDVQLVYDTFTLNDEEVDMLFDLGADRVITRDSLDRLIWYNAKGDEPAITHPIEDRMYATAALGSLLDTNNESKALFALPFIANEDNKLMRADYFGGMKICGGLFGTLSINTPCKVR